MTSEWHLHWKERTWYFVTCWSRKVSWSESTNNTMFPERGQRNTPRKSWTFPLGERTNEESLTPGAEIWDHIVTHTQNQPIRMGVMQKSWGQWGDGESMVHKAPHARKQRIYLRGAGSGPDPTTTLLCDLRQMDLPFWFSVLSSGFLFYHLERELYPII